MEVSKSCLQSTIAVQPQYHGEFIGIIIIYTKHRKACPAGTLLVTIKRNATIAFNFYLIDSCIALFVVFGEGCKYPINLFCIYAVTQLQHGQQNRQ